MKQYLECLIPFINDVNKWTSVIQNGYNGDIDNTWEDLISVGGTIVEPAAEAHVHLLSSSVEDDPDKGGAIAGTGIHTVRLTYVNDDYVLAYEDVGLNGTTAVETTATDIYRILSCRAKVTGTGLSAAGTISIKNHAEALTYGTIAVGNTDLHHAICYVPDGYTLYITGFRASTAKADGSALGMAYFRAFANYHESVGVVSQYYTHAYEAIYASGSHEFNAPLIFPEKTTVKLQAKGLASDSNYLCVGTLEGFLIKA